MAKYWKTEILPELKYLYKDGSREVCGVTVDPVVFLSMYMKRFLYRMDQEGILPVPGTYSIEFKVFMAKEMGNLEKQSCFNCTLPLGLLYRFINTVKKFKTKKLLIL